MNVPEGSADAAEIAGELVRLAEESSADRAPADSVKPALRPRDDSSPIRRNARRGIEATGRNADVLAFSEQLFKDWRRAEWEAAFDGKSSASLLTPDSATSQESKYTLGSRVQALEDSIGTIECLLEKNTAGVVGKKGTPCPKNLEFPSVLESTLVRKATPDCETDNSPPRLGRFRWPMDIKRASEELKQEAVANRARAVVPVGVYG